MGESDFRIVGLRGFDAAAPEYGAASLRPRDWRVVLRQLDWDALAEPLGLSPREVQVVRGILDGDKLQTIARDMRLCLGTVKTYSQRVYQKLGVHDRLELALAIMVTQFEICAQRVPIDRCPQTLLRQIT